MLTVENCKYDLLAVFDYASGLYPAATKSVFATSFGGYITLLCADELTTCPLVLRAPAVTMPKLLLQTVLGITQEQFKQAGHITCGFERLIQLPYAFVEELQRQEDLFAKALQQPTLIIHGDCDDIVPLEDIKAFAQHQKTVSLEIIPGADHRFKKSGELEKILCMTKQFLKL